MKIIVFLILICFGMQSHAQTNYYPPRNNNVVLMARKQGEERYFSLGAPVRMVVKDTSDKKQIVKGYITHLGKNELTIGSFKRNDKSEGTSILPDAIEKIRPLSRRGRKTAVIFLGAAAVYAGTIELISKEGPLQYVLFIPAIGIALAFLYYYPATFLVDLIREKKNRIIYLGCNSL